MRQSEKFKGLQQKKLARSQIYNEERECHAPQPPDCIPCIGCAPQCNRPNFTNGRQKSPFTLKIYDISYSCRQVETRKVFFAAVSWNQPNAGAALEAPTPVNKRLVPDLRCIPNERLLLDPFSTLS